MADRAGATPVPTAPALSGRVLRTLVTGLRSLLGAALIGWGTLAIYFSNLPWAWARTAVAAAFLAFGIWAFWLARRRRPALFSLALVFVGLLVWWAAIAPSHDRPWRPEVSALPRAFIDGDRVRITGVRNFDYRSSEDFTVRYEEREVRLSDLVGVDFFISFWMPGPFGHTFVSFVFDDAPPISVSIETRPEVGEGYSPLASLFKQYELIYVVGNERDVVGVRTNHRGEDVYLYPIVTSDDNVRQLFLLYLERINELAEAPEWYHLLSNSCTINIVRYAHSIGGAISFDPRHYLNGLIDGFLYATGRVDTSLPLAELRQRSHISDAARAAGDAPDFSARIRADLPRDH